MVFLPYDPRDKRRDDYYIDPSDYTRRGGDVHHGFCCGCGSPSQITMKDAERKQREKIEREKFISNQGMVILDL